MSESHYVDGRVALQNVALSIINYSPALVLGYLSDTINHEAVEQMFTDADGSPLGSSTFIGFEAGAIAMKFALADQAGVLPGYVVKLNRGDGDRYYVLGNPGAAFARNTQVNGSFAVKRIYNPIFANLLSLDEGQGKSMTQAAGALTGDRAAAPTIVNTRQGGTLAFTMAAAPGSAALPGWLSCNGTTGALSGTSVAGTWDIEIICTETLAGKITRVGYGVIHLVIT
jgi:hypothetical protein